MGEEQSVKCPECKNKYPALEIADHHRECVRKKHTDKFRKRHVCSTCGKTIKGNHYQEHLKIHRQSLDLWQKVW